MCAKAINLEQETTMVTATPHADAYLIRMCIVASKESAEQHATAMTTATTAIQLQLIAALIIAHASTQPAQPALPAAPLVAEAAEEAEAPQQAALQHQPLQIGFVKNGLIASVRSRLRSASWE